MSIARGMHSRVLLDPHLRHIDPGPRASVAIITPNHQTIVTMTGVATAKASKAPSLIQFPPASMYNRGAFSNGSEVAPSY